MGEVTTLHNDSMKNIKRRYTEFVQIPIWNSNGQKVFQILDSFRQISADIKFGHHAFENVKICLPIYRKCG